jgi:hypothetical protein
MDSPSFSVQGNEMILNLAKYGGNAKYSVFLQRLSQTSILFPGVVLFSFYLIKRNDTTVVESDVHETVFYKTDDGRGVEDWLSPKTIRDYILKVKVWTEDTFSDFVVEPESFKDSGFLLFEKIYSNLSFKVGGEVVYVLRGVLTSRNTYFRDILNGIPENVNSEIPIEGEVDVFKMIIEWIYTMNIKQLNGMSSTLFDDLEKVYIAAGTYQIIDLRDSIVKYLGFLVDDQTFGDIYQIAKKIGNEYLENIVYHSWINESEEYNKIDSQIDILMQYKQENRGKEKNGDIIVKKEGVIKIEEGNKVKLLEDKEAAEYERIGRISHKIIQASNWDGKRDTKMCVIECLTSVLSVSDESTKKRKI